MPGRFEITNKVAVRRGSTMLVLRDAATGEGDLPGGRLEQHELHQDWRDSVARELSEELGPHVVVHLEGTARFWFKHHIRASQCDALGFLWVATWGAGEPVLSAEHDRLHWVELASWDPATSFTGPLLAAVRRYQREG